VLADRAVEVLADKFQRLIYNSTLDREPLQDVTTESETEESDVPPEAPPFERECGSSTLQDLK
jgi:hypothetical protein